ncbi:MAG: sodium-dependent transporter [Planctomycetota bacterium]|jgi:NSS family neurotransmitter:Na+ symporter
MSAKQLAHHRPQWKTHIGFLLAAVGSAIGLGNIWRFPYLAYKNGGGAFLIPYLVALIVVGIPLMILEIGLGHKMRGSAPASYATISKKWEWVGWWQLIFVMFGIVLYYSVIISWCLNFLFFSFNLSYKNDPNSFFFNDFLMKSSSPFQIGDVRTAILFSLAIVWFLNWLIVYRGVQKGLERANKFFMPLLGLLVAIIVIWSLQLSGAKEGLVVYLKPDFAKLKDVEVWIDAFSQIFFTLSLCFGIMIAYASYLPRKSEIVKDSISICLINCIFSVFVGLGVFAVLGYMASKTSQPIDELVDQGIGLAFVAFPKAISMLPSFNKIFGILFFGSLVIAGLSSSISIIEAFTSGIVDKFHYSRKSIVSVLCITGFFGSIIFCTQGGLFWIDIVDHFINHYGLVLAGVFECIIIGWIYKAAKLREHIDHASSIKISSWWDYIIKAFIPVVLIALIINSLINELSAPYEGYPPLSLVVIGRDWLIITLFFALIVAFKSWKIEPSERLQN